MNHDVPKITLISSHIAVMMAGDTLSATTLTQRLQARFKTAPQSVEEVVEAATSLYETLRLEQVDREIFRPRGVTMEQFYSEGLQSRFQPHLVGAIDDEVMGFDYGVELIIAGTDEAGAHLYTIGNPGTANNYRHIGYVAIGNGGIHATQSMIGFGHSGFHALFETLFTVYASKRRSEAAPGVGRDTDVVLIPPIPTPPNIGGAWYLTPDQLKSLDRLYDELRQPERDEIIQRVESLDLFKAEQTHAEHEEAESSGGKRDPAATAKPVSETIQTETDVSPKRK